MTTSPARPTGARGLPLESTRGSETRVGAYLRRDVPTCRLDERLADVRAQVRAAGWETCFVVNDELVVLGRLSRAALAGKTTSASSRR
jgi:hypothetical protein